MPSTVFPRPGCISGLTFKTHDKNHRKNSQLCASDSVVSSPYQDPCQNGQIYTLWSDWRDRSSLRCLLADPPHDLDLSIVLRNKKKLLNQFPDLESSTAFSIRIFEGSNTDRQIWKQALCDTEVVLMCIATNESQKGNPLFSDTATAVTGALQELQAEQRQSYKTPTILMLRAVALNEKLNPGLNSPAILFFALRYLYDAMAEANRAYEAQAQEHPGLLNMVYIDPPAIHDEHGTTPTGYRLDTEPPPGNDGTSHDVSYADLGVAFCEIAARREELIGKGVVVTATGEVKTTWGTNLGLVARGALGRIWG